jgi:hypothetical protein
MSSWQASLTSAEESLGSREARSPVPIGVILGAGLLALGAGLFSVGIFHGFEHGSCSTTGYSANWGPVQHCSKGVGWWMLMVLVGVFLATGGALASRPTRALVAPILFIAVGAPFIALATRSSSAHLLLGSSSGPGKAIAGIFGGCFVIAGIAWGVLAWRGAVSGLGGTARLAGAIAFLAGVGCALAIGTCVASAIGPTTASPLHGLVQPVERSAHQSRPSAAATRQTHAAIEKATALANKADRLAICLAHAGARIGRVQACEAKYTP